MNILITCNTMCYMSGSPLYNYTLAMELAKQHNVYIYSSFNKWVIEDDSKDIMRKNLESVGIKCIDMSHKLDNIRFDLVICSQQTLPKNILYKKLINIIHSEYDNEVPINNANIYVGIRPSIVEHLKNKYNIDAVLVYNGVDRNRFNRNIKATHLGHYTEVVIPCTLDKLRERFLNYWIDKANNELLVMIYGLQCGAKLHTNPFAIILPPTFYIEQAMSEADYIAGILLGRVNLEANSIGIPSYIHNPEQPEEYTQFLLSEEEFDQKHNIINVANQLINL